MDKEAWRATVRGAAKSQIPLNTHVYHGLETVCLRITWETYLKIRLLILVRSCEVELRNLHF